MKTYRKTTTIPKDGKLIIRELPFHPGDPVEVIVRRCDNVPAQCERYPLRGTAIRYTDPFESVAENDWAVLK